MPYVLWFLMIHPNVRSYGKFGTLINREDDVLSQRAVVLLEIRSGDV